MAGGHDFEIPRIAKDFWNLLNVNVFRLLDPETNLSLSQT